jgi:Leucine-rich repeat (LRR) protein
MQPEAPPYLKHSARRGQSPSSQRPVRVAALGTANTPSLAVRSNLQSIKRPGSLAASVGALLVRKCLNSLVYIDLKC